MLILNNGVPKSGSTWIQRLLKLGIDPDFPSETWRNDWTNPSVDSDNLANYVRSEEWKGRPTLIKMHIAYAPKYDFLLRNDIKIIVSYRSIADSVVSWFHHQVRLKNVTLDQRDFWFQTKGRQFAMRAVAHRMSWSNKPGVIPVCYENLLANATGETALIFQALGLELPAGEYERIAEATQVKLKAGSPLREGKHVRTAGRSVAREELPPSLLTEFSVLHQSLPDFQTY